MSALIILLASIPLIFFTYLFCKWMGESDGPGRNVFIVIFFGILIAGFFLFAGQG